MNYSAEQLMQLAGERWGISLKRTGRELHGPCPMAGCGGEDRFWINPNGHFYCRQCHYGGWIEERSKPIDPLVLQKIAEERAKEAERIEERRRVWLNGFRAGALWRQWHDQMQAEHLEWWKKQGITLQQIDRYELGFTDSLLIKRDGKDYLLGAYTIPIRDPKTWDVNYLHYRLSTIPEGFQKYYYIPGVPSLEFYAEQGEYDSAFVVEGAKKAIVISEFIGHKIQVVGLPGMTPSREVMKRIRDQFGEVFLALDPGKGRQEANWVFKQNVPQAKALSLPDKPDDMVMGGLRLSELREYTWQAR